MRTYLLLGSLLLLMLLLAACGQAAPPMDDAAPPVDEEATPADEGETPAEEDVSMEPEPRGESGGGDIGEAARQHLATETGIDEATMTIVSVEEREWPNSALGCPQPGKAYLEVITPGFLVTIEAEGETFHVHANENGSSMVVCEDGAGGDTAQEKDGSQNGNGGGMPAIDKAIAHLAAERDVPEEAISVVDVSKEKWPNSALGCPQPGQDYAEVITPGFRYELEAEGDTFFVHTNQDGSAIVICDESEVEANSEGGTMDGNDAGTNLSGNAAAAGKAAVSKLASETGYASEELTIVEHEAVEWSDSSLGCPKPGEMYMQVITPGHRFVIEGGGEQFNVHTNQDGSATVICDKP